MKNSILILFLTVWLAACQKDYSYLNTDRRPQVIIVSERYTNPPATMVNDKGKIEWVYYKIVYDSLSRQIDYRSYQNLNPDTVISTCSIDKRDSSFKIEIRKYFIEYIY